MQIFNSTLRFHYLTDFVTDYSRDCFISAYPLAEVMTGQEERTDVEHGISVGVVPPTGVDRRDTLATDQHLYPLLLPGTLRTALAFIERSNVLDHPFPFRLAPVRPEKAWRLILPT